MNLPRFFIAPGAVDRSTSSIVLTDETLAKQITHVLRRTAGSPLDLLDGLGNLYHCQLVSCNKNTLKARITASEVCDIPAQPQVTIALPPLKSGRFEWALEKLTELGVSDIVPILVRRSVVKPDWSDRKFEKQDRASRAGHDSQTEAHDPLTERSAKMNRWLTILKESSEQCERLMLPNLVPPILYNQFLERDHRLQPGGLKLICAERREAPFIGTVLDNQQGAGDAGHQQITIAIGAEGGFTKEEVDLASHFSFQPVSLGRSILRAETAAIYALVIALSRFRQQI
jgi:16S rRNA (uracil1498-N3)-methyltransferase